MNRIRLIGSFCFVVAGCGDAGVPSLGDQLRGCPKDSPDYEVARGAAEAEAVETSVFARRRVQLCELERDVSLPNAVTSVDIYPRTSVARIVTLPNLTMIDRLEPFGDVGIVAPALTDARNIRSNGIEDPPPYELPALVRVTDLNLPGNDHLLRLPSLLYAGTLNVRNTDLPLLALVGILTAHVTDETPLSLQNLASGDSIRVGFTTTTTIATLPALTTAGRLSVGFRTATTTVTLPALTTVTDFSFSGSGPRFASFPALTEVSSLRISGFDTLESFSMPHLMQVDSVEFSNNPALDPCVVDDFIRRTRPSSVTLTRTATCSR